MRTINIKGCKCTKTKCLKKYCECFSHGVECTSLCVCCSCKNQKDKVIVLGKFENQKTNYKIYKLSSKLTKEVKGNLENSNQKVADSFKEEVIKDIMETIKESKD